MQPVTLPLDYDQMCIRDRDLGHAALDVGQVLGADDALGRQHVGVRQRTLDVDARQALVEVHGGRVAFDEFGNRFREPGGPGLRLSLIHI